MKNSKSKKRTLLVSVFTVMLCIAMLVGSTFAWFTDTASSGVNRIVAGNLDIKLSYMNVEMAKNTNSAERFREVTSATTDLFVKEGGGEILWEPGAVAVSYLKLENAGSLALQYILSIDGTDTKVTEDGGKLSDVLKTAVVKLDREPAAIYTGEQAIAEARKADAEDLFSYILTSEEPMQANAVQYFALIVYFPEEVGNTYIDADRQEHRINASDPSKCPEIQLGVELYATQVPYEEDSFSPNYDIDALAKAGTKDALVAAIANAKANDVIMLSGNIAENLELTIDKNITLFLNGRSLSTVTATISDGAVFTLESGKADTVTANGAGTLALRNMSIKATSSGSSAVALGKQAAINMVVKGTNTLTGADRGSGISVPATASLTLSGDTLKVIGNNGTENTLTNSSDTASDGGSGIRADGALVIENLKSLTALGYGKAGFGVGGSTSALTIKNTTVEYARGGYARETAYVGDEKYIKSGEGRPAIGIDVAGTVTLENVTVKKAEGGIKSAAIGGSYWNAVTVNITGCTINEAIGGASAAAIGGGRATDNENDKVVISIADTTIGKAQGGAFGAGIGSGYDTNCSGNPSVKITITGSVITAKGGKYAAGIGTGYHVGKLTGSIDGASTINASRPDVVFYKDEYTTAQSIGYGVVDPGREFKDVTVSFTVNGTVIATPTVGN